ncbi:hypothetical protein V5O48_000572 [Marasmius crinis-equi]|uniref:DNA polymerase epsilon subunit D n=1 Tax=Marasmius crinis-equi TaxID=585013 RepID=A0ABR3G0R2_9AGAR
MPRKDNPGPISAQAQQELVSEGLDNFELPKSIVTKIAKSAVPENTKLQKEAILSLVKGSTVFINYLAATQVAHDVAQSKQHKSISASDVLKALEMIELGDLVDPLQAELQVFRDLSKPEKPSSRPPKKKTAQADRRPNNKGKKKASASASATASSSAPYTSIPLGAPDGESISTGPEVTAGDEDVDMEEAADEEEAADDDEVDEDLEGGPPDAPKADPGNEEEGT